VKSDLVNNEDDLTWFDDSAVRMNTTIQHIRHKEENNFMTNYMNDLRECFKSHQGDTQDEETVEDENFKQSKIQKQDFFVLRIKDYLTNECGQAGIPVSELIDINCMICEENDGHDKYGS